MQTPKAKVQDDRQQRLGGRSKLRQLVSACTEVDFERYGKALIESARKTRADYLKIVTALVPKEFSLEGGSLEDFSDGS